MGSSELHPGRISSQRRAYPEVIPGTDFNDAGQKSASMEVWNVLASLAVRRQLKQGMGSRSFFVSLSILGNDTVSFVKTGWFFLPRRIGSEFFGFRSGICVLARLVGGGGAPPMLPKKQPSKSASCSASLTVPELDESKTIVLNMLASAHSRRSYRHAIEKFIAWYSKILGNDDNRYQSRRARNPCCTRGAIRRNQIARCTTPAGTAVQLETDSLGGNPVPRRLKDNEETRPLGQFQLGFQKVHVATDLITVLPIHLAECKGCSSRCLG